MKNEMSIEELQAQIAALKKAVVKANELKSASEKKLQQQIDSLTKTIETQTNTINSQTDTINSQAETINSQIQAIDQYKALIERIRENYDIERFLKYAPNTENLTKKQIQELKKALDETKPDPEEPADRDLGPEPDKEEEKFKKKKWGRQPGTKTGGRNMDFSNKLPKDVIDLDLKAFCDNPSDFVFVRTEDHSQVDYVPSYVRCRVTRVYVYKNMKTGELVYMTPEEHDIIKGGKLTNGFIASYITDRIIWGSPFYRQARRINLMTGCNVVSAQLLSSVFLRVGSELTQIGECLYRNLFKARSLHADETKLLVIHDDETGQRKLGYLWMMSCGGPHPISYARFFASRKKECAQELLAPGKGIAVQTDGYSVYASVVKEMNAFYAQEIAATDGQTEADKFLTDSSELLEKGILLAGCAAHARRKVYLAFQAVYKGNIHCPGGETCSVLLKYFAELYTIEDELRKENLPEEEFVARRKEKAVPVISKIKEYAEKRKPLHEAEPKLKEALVYIHNQIDVIANYLECPELTPDNNSQERLVKTAVVARKACLFASVENGARTWALMHSILQTAVMNKLNPTTYLKFLFDKIAEAKDKNVLAKDMNWEELMPWNQNPNELEKIWNTKRKA